MASSVQEFLKKGLKEALVDCQKIEGRGCTEETNEAVARYIAKPIAEAIELGGGKLEWCGECTVDELNGMEETASGDSRVDAFETELSGIYWSNSTGYNSKVITFDS